ncbi:RNA polymerase subunit sigma-70 [Arthrobacter sp. MYb227]|nr:RNA polymerase subunit sigma-70 [Arthrobacter sp. MYb227]
MPLDASVVSDIYRLHAPELRRFLNRVADDRDAAEDILQETVIKAWQAAPHITGSLRSYLYATARNVLIDRYRRASSRINATSLSDSMQESTSNTTSFDAVLDKVLLEEALKSLSPDHREVVWQLHYLGATVAQTSIMLGVPEGTVKSRAYYAIRSLRQTLEEMGIER